MSKIVGDDRAINQAKSAPAGDRSVYINFDAINELPDRYEAVITEIRYDPRNLAADFSDVGNKTYMPQPHLMYKIAEAAGISGGNKSISEPLIEDVDINPMMLKPMDAEPTIRRMIVGRRVRKYSTRLQEDGTEIRSSVCTIDYNVWERCCELWAKEEMYTEGYSKPGKYPPKYQNQYQRKNHFQSELKFAHAKAETKAHLKTIRELAGMMTGYKQADLQSGSLFFAKVRLSKEYMKLEDTARLSAIAGGHQQNQAAALLFGNDPDDDYEPDPAPQPEDTYEHSAEPEPEPTQPPPQKQDTRTKRELLIWLFEQYQAENMIPQASAEGATTCLNWLKGTPTAEQVPKFWNRSIELMQSIEKQIPAESRIEHGPL